MDATVMLLYVEQLTAVCLYLHVAGGYYRVLENTFGVLESPSGNLDSLWSACFVHML